jgi:hypothetical protein
LMTHTMSVMKVFSFFLIFNYTINNTNSAPLCLASFSFPLLFHKFEMRPPHFSNTVQKCKLSSSRAMRH